MSPRSLRPGARYLLASIVVAVLDIAFAIAYWVGYRGLTTAPRILRSIASGLLGPSAMDGGAGTAALGAVLHLAIAMIWTAILLVGLRRVGALARLVRRPGGAILLGAPFGMIVWLAMNFVVTPLAHGSATPPSRTAFWVMLIWHAIGVGIPMAAVLRGAVVSPGSSA